MCEAEGRAPPQVAYRSLVGPPSRRYQAWCKASEAIESAAAAAALCEGDQVLVETDATGHLRRGALTTPPEHRGKGGSGEYAEARVQFACGQESAVYLFGGAQLVRRVTGPLK